MGKRLGHIHRLLLLTAGASFCERHRTGPIRPSIPMCGLSVRRRPKPCVTSRVRKSPTSYKVRKACTARTAAARPTVCGSAQPTDVIISALPGEHYDPNGDDERGEGQRGNRASERTAEDEQATSAGHRYESPVSFWAGSTVAICTRDAMTGHSGVSATTSGASAGVDTPHRQVCYPRRRRKPRP
jgi:hypothetical protein